jgi:hypothetical protein
MVLSNIWLRNVKMFCTGYKKNPNMKRPYRCPREFTLLTVLQFIHVPYEKFRFNIRSELTVKNFKKDIRCSMSDQEALEWPKAPE